MEFFTNSDYEVFTAANATVMNPEMAARRKAVQNKLITLHESIYPEVQKLGLRCHKDKRHLTTEMIDRHTGRANTWLLIRYNNTPAAYDEFSSFTNYADIQFGISEDKGFEIDLFLGRKDGVDRFEAMKRLHEDTAQITEAIAALKGYGLQWILSCAEPFDLDTREPSEFCEWLASNDKLSEESYLTCFYSQDDDRISEQHITEELLARIRQMLPLYRILTHR